MTDHNRNISVACTQLSIKDDVLLNLDQAERVVRKAAAEGAQIILLSEFFATLYFCQEQKEEHFRLAHPAETHPFLDRFARLAAELQVVLPVSFFERSNSSFFNSIAVFDADGTNLGVYRKSHIPDGPGYQEKFYFNPGDTGFKVFKTRFATIGVAICWDQWFPEAARAMALQGAEVLFYPTAIGSEPQDARLNSYPHWTRVMMGHAGANVVPLVASNRIGTERFSHSEITFYGGSFITDHQGAVVKQVGGTAERGQLDPAPRQVEGFEIATFDLDAIRWHRASWGLFRDRRVDLYDVLLSSDGQNSYHRQQQRQDDVGARLKL